MVMLKSDLVEKIAKDLKMNHDIAQLVVNNIFDSMTEALRRGESIEIRGFGSFSVRHYEAREGRNPKTGEQVTVPPRKKPFFKVGKELKNRVNS
jgi:integration host factor subunit beta